METRSDVLKAAQAMDEKSRKAGRRALNYLPDLLTEREEVRRIVQGFYMNGNALTSTAGGDGILVATDRRLIFLYKGWFMEASEEFPLGQVSSIQYKSDLASAALIVHGSGGKAKITMVDKKQARSFATYVSSNISF